MATASAAMARAAITTSAPRVLRIHLRMWDLFLSGCGEDYAEADGRGEWPVTNGGWRPPSDGRDGSMPVEKVEHRRQFRLTPRPSVADPACAQRNEKPRPVPGLHARRAQGSVRSASSAEAETGEAEADQGERAWLRYDSKRSRILLAKPGKAKRVAAHEDQSVVPSHE